MAIERDDVRNALRAVSLPGGGDLVSRDMVRAVQIDGGRVQFVIEAASAEEARALAQVRTEAEAAVHACRYAPEGGRSFGPVRAAAMAIDAPTVVLPTPPF